MRDVGYLRTKPLMGTIVTMQVVGHGADSQRKNHQAEVVERGFEWFRCIEECCTRFDPRSELMQLVSQVGVAVPVSAILYEAVQFALAVAEESGGAFDPTVGYRLETLGFDRESRTGEIVRTALATGDPASFRDVCLDPDRKTIKLLRPLILDLGAVAKGLAIDMAARELQEFENFSIYAGGDLYLGGCNPQGELWSIGIRHPRRDDEFIETIRVSNRAVCTSGDYERRRPSENNSHPVEHHILDPRTNASANKAASATVVAPTAMLADALATAAFVLGPEDGIQFLERMGVDGLIVSATLEKHMTRGMSSDYKLGGPAILQDAKRPADHHSGDSDGARRTG